MLFRNHLIVTGAIAVVTVKFGNFDSSIWLQVLMIIMGSLLPDLDHPGSTIGKRVLFISIPLSAFFGHRQITHSLWPFVGVLLLFGADGLMSNEIVLCIAIGYASHLFADILTDSGIPFFWPLQYRFKSLIPAKTGGVFEYVLAYGLFLSSFYF
ncbi:metal-dependent hydrolase [Shewanella sp. UCD-KL12]|uniref:metal-dependent hydrolase n=1 Tax=Shewanella sp. UCD-KL12 TaxID=1917163 RepID=UPI00097125D9|nr:metal-dependent hydrolase [Shewanella sp. UCD-KL12]